MGAMLVWVMSAFAGWQAQNAAGDCAGVLKSLPAPSVDLEKLAVSRCLVATGNPGRALELFPLQRDELKRYGAMVAAEAYLARDRPEDALAALAGFEPADAGERLLRAKVLVAAKRSTEARDPLRALLETRYGDEARYWLAVGASDRGEKDAAISTFKAVWSRHPTSVWSERAVTRLGQLGAKVPDFDTAEGRELAWKRVNALLDAQQAELAVPLIESLAARQPLSNEQRWQLARAYGSARQHQKAVTLYAELGAPTASASRAFAHALSTARSGDYSGAAELYKALILRFPGTSEAEEASYKRPYMRYDARDYAWAVPLFDAYVEAYPAGKFVVDARWFTAWSLHQLGKDAEAMVAMKTIIDKHPSSELAIAARYWRARLSADRAGLEAVLSAYPDSGYAWFAADRLKKTWPAVADVSAPEFSAGFLAARPKLRTGLDLVRAGFVDWGRASVVAEKSAAQGAGKAEALAMAWALVDAESYAEARAVASPWCQSGVPEAVQVCTTRPYRAVVEATSAEYGLPSMLPYAIMNAESGLDPSVTSPAGARGLMQLMPRLAQDLATDMPSFTIDDLYRAGVNARLGTRELGLLFQRFGAGSISPSLPLVIAGYNGGADSVARWVGAYPQAPEADQFAEDISYTETRRYVRRVLGFLMKYRRVYGDRPAG